MVKRMDFGYTIKDLDVDGNIVPCNTAVVAEITSSGDTRLTVIYGELKGLCFFIRRRIVPRVLKILEKWR